MFVRRLLAGVRVLAWVGRRQQEACVCYLLDFLNDCRERLRLSFVAWRCALDIPWEAPEKLENEARGAPQNLKNEVPGGSKIALRRPLGVLETS